MSTKKRNRNKENQGLPKRWRLIHGAYYYSVPPGQESKWNGKKTFRLGKSLSDAYKEWSNRLKYLDKARTVADLLDRYALEVIPTKAPRTRTENTRQLNPLRRSFGSAYLSDVRPVHIYQYMDAHPAKVAARREITLLSHVFSKAVLWGLIEQHPFKGQISFPRNKPRNRYVEDWEIIEALSLPAPPKRRGGIKVVQAYIQLKLITGLARGDLLRLQPNKHFTEEGIEVQRHKTAGTSGKSTVYLWTPELHAAVKEALAARPVDIAPFVFCNRHGQGYFNEATGTAAGWDSMWQRFMARVLKETKVTERFTEHDLRAKCASDAENLDHARALLTHEDPRLTQRVYRRKPERVMPLKGIQYPTNTACSTVSKLDSSLNTGTNSIKKGESVVRR
uniref:Phage integrase family protein n=1 Tax=Candidatus Kentrum sp. LFY TaxID=2126342 RepID=A0A450WBY9_9GAMM|nr:MAG: hypothetical protein BECKLFY1418C_GA0070996_100932 [Candidatus Kentron sp. LFY]